MRRLTRSTLFALGLAATFWSCSNTTPTTVKPNPNPITEQFSGTLAPSGAQTFTFAATTLGTVTAVLTTLSPDSTTQVGMSVGTWNGSACSAFLSTQTAIQGSSLTVTATTASILCVRVFDPGSVLTNTESIVVSVTHP